MNKHLSIITAVLVTALWSGGVFAFNTWTAGCNNCHGAWNGTGTYTNPAGKTSSVGANLMNSHSQVVGGCNTCHSKVAMAPGQSTVALCGDCHGREQDAAGSTGPGAGPFRSAGLRKANPTHASVCSGCHAGDTATPVAENVPPAGFSALGIDPCNDVKFIDGLDNDGNGLKNAADPACVQNTPPVANNDTASTAHNTAVTINVLANDTDADGDTLSISSFDATSANAGTVSCTTTCTYTPATGFSGSDTFTYNVSDGTATSNRATVTVTVAPPGNTAPVANNDTATTPQDTAVTINVLTNDTDADGDTLTISSFDATSTNGGTVNCTTTCTYTPAPGFTGTDTFTYKATDGTAVSNSATVTITVTSTANTPPVANDNSATTPQNTAVTINVLANDTDADGDALSINNFSATTPAGGTVNCTTTCTYTPASGFTGTDSFTYDVTDGKAVSNTATVTITVTAVQNQPPTCSVTATPSTGMAPLNVNFTATASDPDGTVASYLWSNGATGTSTSATYNAGTHTMSLTVTDNKGATATCSATVTVQSPTQNKPPQCTITAMPSTGTEPLWVKFIATASDPDGNVVSYRWGNGSTRMSTSATYKAGTHTMSLTVTDNKGATGSCSATVTVKPAQKTCYDHHGDGDSDHDDDDDHSGESCDDSDDHRDRYSSSSTYRR
ncbi:MAG: Ig-like domain-containing protein [Pseudomonadota bacterium]